MKPTLKVGDYAEVITDEMEEKGKVGQVTNIIRDRKYPIRVNFYDNTSTSFYTYSELRKCGKPFELLPSLPELEQYRLSLEVYRDLLQLLCSDLNNSGTWYTVAESFQIKLLTEILEE